MTETKKCREFYRCCKCSDEAKHVEGNKGYCDEHYLLLATERWQEYCSKNK